MTYQSTHIYYVFTGRMPGGELWNVGLRTITAVVPLDLLQQYAQNANLAFQSTVWAPTSGARPYNSPGVTYEGCTAYQVPTTGPATLVTNAPAASSVPGTATAQTAPNQTAIVASLRTARAGRSSRGRIYLPMDAPVMAADNGRLNPGVRVDVCTAVANLLDNIGVFTPPGGASGPFPIAIQSQVRAGTPIQVTSVQVGDVLDTQRRRRDKLVESYYAVPLSI